MLLPTGEVPSVVPPSLNDTVPVGRLPEESAASEAVRVRGWLSTDDVFEEVKPTVVA